MWAGIIVWKSHKKPFNRNNVKFCSLKNSILKYQHSKFKPTSDMPYKTNGQIGTRISYYAVYHAQCTEPKVGHYHSAAAPCAKEIYSSKTRGKNAH